MLSHRPRPPAGPQNSQAAHCFNDVWRRRSATTASA